MLTLIVRVPDFFGLEALDKRRLGLSEKRFHNQELVGFPIEVDEASARAMGCFEKTNEQYMDVELDLLVKSDIEEIAHPHHFELKIGKERAVQLVMAQRIRDLENEVAKLNSYLNSDPD